MEHGRRWAFTERVSSDQTRMDRNNGLAKSDEAARSTGLGAWIASIQNGISDRVRIDTFYAIFPMRFFEAGFLASRQQPTSLTAKSPQSLHNLGTKPPRDTPPDPRSHKRFSRSVGFDTSTATCTPPTRQARRQKVVSDPRGRAHRHIESRGRAWSSVLSGNGTPASDIPVVRIDVSATPRSVSGWPIAAAVVEAAVIPVTMSAGVPTSFNAANSPPARPKIPGSPALSRTARRLFCASAKITRLI